MNYLDKWARIEQKMQQMRLANEKTPKITSSEILSQKNNPFTASTDGEKVMASETGQSENGSVANAVGPSKDSPNNDSESPSGSGKPQKGGWDEFTLDDLKK